MLIRVDKESVIDGFSRASAVANAARKSATYSRMLWLGATAGESTVEVMATDLAVEFVGRYDADVEEPGLIGVNGKNLVELLRGFPAGGRITLETVGGDGSAGEKLAVKCGRQRYHLPVGDATWFAPMERCSEPAVIVPADVLTTAIDRVEHCISPDVDTDGLNCLYMHQDDDGNAAVCGMNGHDFAKFSFAHEELAGLLGEKGVLVALRYAAYARKWIRGEKLAISITPKRVFLTSPERAETISLPRSSCAFPEYSAFMSRVTGGAPSTLIVKREELMASLRRIVPFLSDVDKSCLFTLESSGLKLTVDNESGSGEETLDAVYDGEIGGITFPARNWLDMAEKFVSPMLEVKLTTAEGPCLITGEDDANYVVLTMPMKTAEPAYNTQMETLHGCA